MSAREAARVFGLHRDTVRKMLKYSVPPGYRRERPARRPKLDPYKGVIDQILEQDQTSPKKQRHTAKRIYERLRDEHSFPGKYTIVKDYVRERRCHTREMFVPLSHSPGHAQCDFGETLVVIGGVQQKAHYFAMDLPHSDGCYVKAYPAETTSPSQVADHRRTRLRPVVQDQGRVALRGVQPAIRARISPGDIQPALRRVERGPWL